MCCKSDVSVVLSLPSIVVICSVSDFGCHFVCDGCTTLCVKAVASLESETDSAALHSPSLQCVVSVCGEGECSCAVLPASGVCSGV